jgi:polyisoprenoid-binding protein YceI
MAIEFWQADPTHSEITFKLRHLILATIEGRARLERAEIRIDPEQPARSSIEGVIDAQSIDTGLPERDDHIRSPEFLDAALHREIRFKSTSVVPAGDGRCTSFDRQNFKLHWNQDLDRGGVVLGDKVDVTIALEASRGVPAAPDR